MAKYLKDDIPILKSKIEEIIDLIKSNEDVTIVTLPRAGKTYFSSKFEDKRELKKLLPQDIISKNIFVQVDLNQDKEFLEENLHNSLERYSSKDIIRDQIEEVIEMGHNLTFVIDNFNTDDDELVRFLLNLSHIALKNIHYIFLTLASDFYNNKNINEFTQTLRNIVHIPYLTKEQSLEWIDTQISDDRIRLTQEEKDEICDFAGGIPSLIKHCLRLKKRIKNIKDIEKAEETKLKVAALWSMFDEQEKEVIKNSYLLKINLNNNEEYRYLQDLNLIDKKGRVIGNWIGTLLNDKFKGTKVFKIEQGNIYWDGEIINNSLTKTEEKLFLHLLMNKTETLGREDIVKVIWGEKAASGISDYAIDQAVSRLRKKLDRVGIGGEIIKTLKGKGFTLEHVNVI